MTHRATHRAALTLLLAAGFGAAAHAASDRPVRSIVGSPAALADGADLVFVAAGDSRPTGSGAPLPRVVRTVFEEIGLIRPDFVLWSGDSVYGYCDTSDELRKEHDAFVALATLGKSPLYNATGNHEIHAQQTCKEPPAAELCGGPCAEKQFVERYGNLYGSFDVAGAHFIALSTDVGGQEDDVTGEQLEWLKRDLEANKNARAIFVFCHTEFYGSPKIDPDAGRSHPPLKNRDALHTLFQQYPVKAVFSGHEHLYWRETHDNIDYFILGGAGAPLYAAPDNGGFAQYLVVRLSGSKVTYDLIEPGRLFVEPVAGAAAGESKFWVVNSNDSELPLRGIEVEGPGGAPCANLTTSATMPRRKDNPPPFTMATCTDTAGGQHLRYTVGAFPAGKSILVTVAKKAAGTN
jgi:hypothetical protein